MRLGTMGYISMGCLYHSLLWDDFGVLLNLSTDGYAGRRIFISVDSVDKKIFFEIPNNVLTICVS